MTLTDKEIPIWTDAYSQAWAVHRLDVFAADNCAEHADQKIERLRDRMGDPTDVLTRVERALEDVDLEIKTKHAAERGHGYTDGLRLAAKWIREALKEPEHG